jgi:hypothetical protein
LLGAGFRLGSFAGRRFAAAIRLTSGEVWVADLKKEIVMASSAMRGEI